MERFEIKPKYNAYDLVDLIAYLRSPNGCPWDREQTHESIRRNLLEEAYEAAEAIDRNDTPHLLEELGDVLLQVAFHAQIEREKGNADLDVIADLTIRKLINRHPHVFGDIKLDNALEVLDNWDSIKRTERGEDSLRDTLSGITESLPALWRAEKITKKLSAAGVD